MFDSTLKNNTVGFLYENTLSSISIKNKNHAMLQFWDTYDLYFLGEMCIKRQVMVKKSVLQIPWNAKLQPI